MTKIVRVLRIWLAEELRILAFRLDPEPDLARDRKILLQLCTHPRLVPRGPCPQCSGRDPLTARWG